MINWFNMPAEGLSNGGQFVIKELTATENKVYEKDGEVYSKVTVNVEGGGGSSDFSTAEVNVVVTGEDPHDVPINVPVCKSLEGFGDFALASTLLVANETSTVILYKGKCLAMVTGDEYYNLDDFNVSGNATLDKEQGLLTITGDCTITCVYTPIS